MTFRAIIIGILLAGFIASFTFFNDGVIRQTQFVGSFLPISLFGLLLLMALGLNPLLGLVRLKPLRAGELLIIAAIGLAACPWPGSNFWRYTGAFVTTPARYYALNPAWRAQGMMSYVPDGSPEVAPGQVWDWHALSKQIADRATTPDQPDDAKAAFARQLWLHTHDAGRAAIAEAAALDTLPPTAVPGLVTAVNVALASPALAEELGGLGPGVMPERDALPGEAANLLVERDSRALTHHEILVVNRALLDTAMPDLVLPRPRGGPLFAGQGDPSDPAVEALVLGVQDKTGFPDPRLVPWRGLLPSLSLWTAIAFGLGLCSLLIAVIVHPQWSRRELLAYPIPRFLREVTAREEHRLLPTVATSPMFWIAMGLVFGIHLVNGLHVWFPAFPDIPLKFNFTPMLKLFPGVSKIAQHEAVFHPQLYFTVVGFAYFLPRAVSFSLGISVVLWLVFGALLLPWGVMMPYEKFSPNHTNALRLGSYLAMMGVILYIGRRYYMDVTRAALIPGSPRNDAAPPVSAIWCARLLPVAVVGLVALLTLSGLDWLLAVALVAVCLMVLVVFSRVVCETGAFLMSGPFMPAAVLVGLLGYEAIGPTGFAVLAFAGFLMLGDPREAVMPFIATGLEMAQQAERRQVIGKVAALLAAVLLASIVLAGFVTISLQSQHTVLGPDAYARERAPTSMFRDGLPLLVEARDRGTLQESIAVSGLSRLGVVRPTHGTVPWLILGMVLVIGCALARMRIPNWPLHPVIFLVWGTWAIRLFGFSFFLGWAIKSAAISVAGIGGYQRLKPVMVGIIAGELSAGLLWAIVGVWYFFETGQTPKGIIVLP